MKDIFPFLKTFSIVEYFTYLLRSETFNIIVYELSFRPNLQVHKVI